MAGDIANICQQLGAAVELTMNPSVPMEQRHQVIPMHCSSMAAFET